VQWDAAVSAFGDSFELRYSAALDRFLANPGEASLHAAYELGRVAAADGLGVVGIAMLHDEAIQRVITASGAAPTAATTGQASQFLSECLAPYEMMLSAYAQNNAMLVESIDRLHDTRAALAIVNQELEAFSYSVAHDLRAPLRSVLGFSTALLEDHSDQLNDEGRRYLRYMGESAREMAQLIEDLLTLSRVARGDLRREHVDVSALAQGVIGRLSADQPERLVELAIEPGLAAWCDARLLTIVLENLIGNAWKFTSRRTDAIITVGSLEDDGQPAWFVRDNGAGFDMAYAEKLFGVFQRLHSADEFGGTGIGLATVRRVISRHRGRVWGEGAVGQGATFCFTLNDHNAKNGDS
jgi:light-regulated signal transduction histidine kinase (bacteriophytochrome)